jgi:hypothetical protein
MIGSWFAQGATWAWEVTAADSTVIASGVAEDEATARWECRMAIFVAGTADGPGHTGNARRAERADRADRASFGGRLCGRPTAA